MAIYLTLGAFLLATGLSKGQGQILKDTQDILDTILSGYNSDIRPAFNQSLPVEVNITTIYMFHITEFKEVSEQLTSVLVLDLLWEDYRLTWDPLDHNGTEYVHIPVTKIWKPSLLLTSPVDRNSPIGDNQNWMVVKCFYDGSIEWTIPDIVTSRCGIDIRYFPFDTQYCNMLFIPGGYYKGEVLLIGGDETISLIYYTENGAWILEESQVLYEYSSFGM
ncbi:neuronal acetylcholine receptor subunit alpha-3-like [Ruditapes philippinarum]|uniref:neuronal acetylcholine receptor subunit alpha-3-like n=1 Tax=Ruditapes philippinarum TaxID=129788 RepID=UPI00295B897B|nr:neuronal acetylcholine receptor subunit alpha-3-like [Ruditapes philippinarum]